ncbi:hypothetical protein [Aeoliella sp. SH292]|uniref:hypothetical protein n=1 Tax=Aeoliella sp. SH292 TaxID=3454464 RepID=UPI003F9B431C
MLLLLGLASGCVEEKVDGTTHTFTYDWWIPTVMLLGGVLAIPIGLALRRTSSRFGWALIIGGPIAALGVAPSLFLDRSVVDDQHFSVRSGIWGMTAIHDVDYDQLAHVRYIVEESTGRRGRKNLDYYLVCTHRDGSSSKIPMGNPCAEAAAVEFLRRATALNIPIHDETHGAH